MKLRSRVAQNEDGLFIALENDGIGARLIRGERWEAHFPQVLSVLPLEATTVLDVGANIGANTVSLARAVGDRGVVVAFEPQRIPFQQLCGTVVLNGFPNVITLQRAVGDTIGMVELQSVNYFADDVNIGNTGLGIGGERVEMTTLDTVGLGAVSFMKLDVQGSETAVLRGARALIDASRPFMFLEVEEVQLRDRGSSAEELVKLVFDMGYDLLHIQNDYPVDFVAVPKEQRSIIPHLQGAITNRTQLCVAD